MYGDSNGAAALESSRLWSKRWVYALSVVVIDTPELPGAEGDVDAFGEQQARVGAEVVESLPRLVGLVEPGLDRLVSSCRSW